MPKARTSLVFKGPANPSGRRTKLSANDKNPSTTVVVKKIKKKPTISLDLSDNDDDDEKEVEPQVAVESEKKKGKRKAVEGTEPEPVSSKYKVVHYEASIALSTVEKTWKPLSEASRDELEGLAKKVETELKANVPPGVTKSELKEVVAKYLESFMSHLEDLQLPPFPSTLKPRATASTSKDTIDLLDAEYVKKKIEATRTSLDKEEKLLRELEEEIKNLKGTNPKSRKRVEAEEVVEHVDEEEMVVLPVKKKKKVVTIETPPVSSPSKPKPKPKKKKPIPILPPSSSKSTSQTKSILKPPHSPPLLPSTSRAVASGDSDDDFDTFPLPPPSKKLKSITKKKTSSSVAPKRRPSLAGKKKSS